MQFTGVNIYNADQIASSEMCIDVLNSLLITEFCWHKTCL